MEYAEYAPDTNLNFGTIIGGRSVYSGVLAGEDERNLHLRVTNQAESVTIPKSQIQDREISELSMMSEGLLDGFADQEVLDLIAYLRSLEQVLMQEVASR